MPNKGQILKKTVTIIDTFGFFFRSYYALPPLKSKDGFPTGLLTGFMNFINTLGKDFQTDFMLFAIDSSGGSFRKDIYSEYKANRSEAPEDLKQQLPVAIKWIEKMGFKSLAKQGFEADDIIASIATICEQKGYTVRVVSHDKDLYQLINKNIFLFDPVKRLDITEKSCELKYGVTPEQFTDYQSIVGDSSDNIPGIKGMGAKSASLLLKQFNTLDGIYQNIDFISKTRFKTLLREHKQNAYMSKQLVTLVKDIYNDIDMSDFLMPSENPILNIKDELSKYDMYSFVDKVNSEGMYIKTGLPNEKPKEQFEAILINDINDLLDIIDNIKDDSVIAFDTETTSLEINKAQIVGFSFCIDKNKAYYVPIAHKENIPQISKDDSKEAISLLFRHKIIGQNIKYDLEILSSNFGLDNLKIEADTMILAWLINPSSRVGLDELAKKIFSYQMIKFTDVVTKNETFADIDIKSATKYASEDAWMTYRIYFNMLEKIEPKILQTAKEVEFPFIDVLTKMESKGIRVDREFFELFQKRLAQKLITLEDEIHKSCNEKFNIRSTKQLAEILFVKLGLPAKRKTKTGYSTDEKVLLSLKDKHPIISFLLQYRELFKIQSTYIEPIISYAKTGDNIIYASFLQTGTSTGRLSSKNPNLQNIPARSKIGKEIRKGFIPRDGYKLIGIDYSQIELRLLAHFSKDATLIDAFNNKEDIHTKTAIKIFGEDLAQEKRSAAKSINFGLLYGMGSKKLSAELKITTSEAKEYITSYFDSFPSVKKKLENIKAEAEKSGFVETLNGRKRYFKFDDATVMELAAYQRESVNTIFQGSAADLIKMSMIKINNEVAEANILLQIHDELIIEVKKESVIDVAKKCEEIMINIAILLVPLEVSVNIGDNMSQLK
jgi:DNA polymerase-1